MLWANFLHIYQPPDQRKMTLKSVVKEAYQPLISILNENPLARITLSVIGCLLVRLDDEGFGDVIKDLESLLVGVKLSLLLGRCTTRSCLSFPIVKLSVKSI